MLSGVSRPIYIATEAAPKRKRKRGGGGRKPFPPEIPRRDVHVDLAPDECYCDCCGREYVFMGVEVTEVLNIIPMICEVIRYIRHRYKRECHCRKPAIVIAEMPIRTIDKGSVTTEFIAAVLVNKYCDHLPVYSKGNVPTEPHLLGGPVRFCRISEICQEDRFDFPLGPIATVFILHPAIKWLLLIIVGKWESGKVGRNPYHFPTFSLSHFSTLS